MCYASTGKSLVSAASDEMNACHQTYCSLPLSADSFISRCFHTTFHYIFTLKFPDFSVDFWTQHKIKQVYYASKCEYVIATRLQF